LFQTEEAVVVALLRLSDAGGVDLVCRSDRLFVGCLTKETMFGLTELLLTVAGGFSLGAIDPSLYRGRPGESDDDLLFPDDHLGRVWFTARFEPTAEKLQVCLLKAKNLPSRTVGTVNSCDPYVR